MYVAYTLLVTIPSIHTIRHIQGIWSYEQHTSFVWRNPSSGNQDTSIFKLPRTGVNHSGPSPSSSCRWKDPRIWSCLASTRRASAREFEPALPSFQERRVPAGNRCCKLPVCCWANPWSVTLGSSPLAGRACGRCTLVWFPENWWILVPTTSVFLR